MRHSINLANILAICGSIAFHAGIAFWLMQPSPPIIIAQQQVIQVAMVDAPNPSEKTSELAKKDANPKTIKSPTIKQIRPQKAIAEKPALRKIIAQKPIKSEPANSKNIAQAVQSSESQKVKTESRNAALTKPIFNAAYLSNPPPNYPQLARRRGVEGRVLLSVDVSANGVANSVRVKHSSGSTMLDKAAQQAVTKWRFVPAQRGGKKIAANITIPIIFKLQ